MSLDLHTSALPTSADTLAVSRRLPLRPPPYTDDVARAIGNTAFKGLSPQNLRLALAQEPKLATAFQNMAHVVLFKGDLPERDREIAIIRTGALTRSEYEWGMHVSIYAARCKLDEAQIADLTTGQPDMASGRWTTQEVAIATMVDELHAHSTVSDATWSTLQSHWPLPQVMELIFASSFYHMAAFFLNSAAVPLESGSRRFPDGLSQARVPDESTAMKVPQ